MANKEIRKLWYLGLEPYEARYTLQLQHWNEAVFKQENIDYEVVTGDLLGNEGKIVTGSVLDAHGRSYYSLTQIANLVKLMQEGKVTSDDVIFFEDMFTPGIEALPYIMDQCPAEFRPRVYVRCLAQTVDPDDFVNREGMFNWMRRFEQICDEFVDGILVASEELVAHLRIAGFKAPIYVTGLPFGKEEVRTRLPAELKPLNERKKRVVFAARWDDEKLPHFYMDLAEQFNKFENINFTICCGHEELKSNNPEYVERAMKMHNDPSMNFTVETGLKKEEYYAILADSCILFNCALQDWVSNTVSEADTAGCMTVYPAYRSFPEVFANNEKHMYIPWSVNSATDTIVNAMNLVRFGTDAEKYNIGKISDY